jgi:cap1 methyltransferase
VEECRDNAAVTTLRHSWLVEGVTQQQQQQQDTSADSSNVQDDLRCLTRQLTQLKRRLGTAKQECAVAASSHGQSGHRHSMTAERAFSTSRHATNPMEVLGQKYGLNRHLFLNRSAMKLANLDAMLEFSLTTWSRSLFLFADLCGAPGGFSEYLLKRCQAQQKQNSMCRGYGMSLLGDNEHGTGLTWRLQDCCQQEGSCVTSFLVSKGADGTGDLYNWDNVVKFQEEITNDLVQAGLGTRKMDLVVADGGFDAQRESECQEALSQKLILCEFAAGLDLLQPGGTMVVKLFGCQTESIRTAMRFMYDHFEWIQELKPISSRPASQERYAVFTGFTGLSASWKSGPQWISSVMTGKCNDPGRTDADYLEFDLYLDQIDRDMMALNLKACFAILTDLERKTAAARAGRSLKEKNNQKHHHSCVKLYRRAWKLGILQKVK